MPKKKPVTTRILCKKEGKFHTVTFHVDGTAASSGCGDVTDAAKRIAAAITLGKAVMDNSCAGLAALAVHGIPAIFRQPPTGEYIRWGGWYELYRRFEENQQVVAAVSRERRRRARNKRDRQRESAIADSARELSDA